MIDVFVRVFADALQRHALGDAAALQHHIDLVDGKPHAAGFGDDVEQPVALDAERDALRGADALAADGDRRADRLGVGDQHLRLDRLALERVLDNLLHRARRAPGDRDAAGVRHRDRAVAPDHLLGDRRAVGAGGQAFRARRARRTGRPNLPPRSSPSPCRRRRSPARPTADGRRTGSRNWSAGDAPAPRSSTGRCRSAHRACRGIAGARLQNRGGARPRTRQFRTRGEAARQGRTRRRQQARSFTSKQFLLAPALAGTRITVKG